MKKLFVFLVILNFIISGCSVKKFITKDPLYEKTLKYTQRGQIINSLETRALIDAIYLNPLYPKKFQNPTFLIGVYNDFDNELINNEFNLSLNNTPPAKISTKIPDFIPYKFYPFYNEWMKYYLVEFNQTNPPYKLIYKSRHWGEVDFTF